MDGRRNEDGSRQYEVQEIQALHREILRLKLLGLTNIEIGAQLDITPQTVSNTVNSSICREHLNGLQEARDADATDVVETIKQVLPDCLQVLQDIVKGTTPVKPMDRALVARDLLDRGGYGKVTNIRSVNSNMHLTVADLDEIQRRAEEKRAQREATVDTTAQEVGLDAQNCPNN